MSFTPFEPIEPTGPYSIEGITLTDGERPKLRKELRQLKKDDPTMFNLYLLGLWQFQLVPQDKQLSYFQIAGIHGLPYEEWPKGDQKLLDLKKEPDSGFCTHTSILFLTWHRPYLALFESTLRDAMLHVAKQFTVEEGQAKYLKAAEAFRMPYWDWALPQTKETPVFPDEATDSAEAEVVVPETMRAFYNLTKDAEGRVKIHNPLWAYKWQPGTSGDFKIDNLDTTTRYHQDGAGPGSPTQQKSDINASITPFSQGVRQVGTIEINLRENVVYLLKAYKRFDQVSHNRWNRDTVVEPGMEGDKLKGLGFGSIENIHNTVHNLCGGTGDTVGHMSGIAFSAFDPIFWLHHTNIDRLLAIWQDLRKDPNDEASWVTTKAGPAGLHAWGTAPGADEGLLTPLAPFYKDKDTFWNSDHVRRTETFGYAYPETKSWEFCDPAEYRADIERHLDALYPSGSLATMIAAKRAGDDQPENLLKTRATLLSQVDKVPEPATALTALAIAQATLDAEPLLDLAPIEVPSIDISYTRSLTKLAKNGRYLEWLFNIKAQKHALRGQYAVHAFLGRVPPEETTTLYPASPYHVGSFVPLGQSGETACGKCRRDQADATEITGQIPLTIALAERYFAGWLPSLSEDDVVKYLTENLHWEVVNEQGERLQGHRDAVDGLLVGVASNEVKLPQEGQEFPWYSPDIKLYPEITTKEDGSTGRAEGTGITPDNMYFGLDAVSSLSH